MNSYVFLCFPFSDYFLFFPIRSHFLRCFSFILSFPLRFNFLRSTLMLDDPARFGAKSEEMWTAWVNCTWMWRVAIHRPFGGLEPKPCLWGA